MLACLLIHLDSHFVNSELCLISSKQGTTLKDFTFDNVSDKGMRCLLLPLLQYENLILNRLGNLLERSSIFFQLSKSSEQKISLKKMYALTSFLFSFRVRKSDLFGL